jgi:hypothetical protein
MSPSDETYVLFSLHLLSKFAMKLYNEFLKSPSKHTILV